MHKDLRDVITKNKQGLERDLTRFVHLNEHFSHVPVAVGNDSFEVAFEEGDVIGTDVVLKGNLNHHDLHLTHKPVELVKASVHDDQVEYEFTQDIDLQGNPTKHVRKISGDGKYEYVDVRNQICQQLHHILVKHYSGENAVKLVRKAIKEQHK